MKSIPFDGLEKLNPFDGIPGKNKHIPFSIKFLSFTKPFYKEVSLSPISYRLNPVILSFTTVCRYTVSIEFPNSLEWRM